MAASFRVQNVALVNRALEQADADIRAQGKNELTALGRLVEHDIEARAPRAMRNMTVQWTQFRTRQTPNLVYVVPQRRSSKIPARKRPNFAREMKRDAMLPALESKRGEINRRYAALVARVCGKFNA